MAIRKFIAGQWARWSTIFLLAGCGSAIHDEGKRLQKSVATLEEVVAGKGSADWIRFEWQDSATKTSRSVRAAIQLGGEFHVTGEKFLILLNPADANDFTLVMAYPLFLKTEFERGEVGISRAKIVGVPYPARWNNALNAIQYSVRYSYEVDGNQYVKSQVLPASIDPKSVTTGSTFQLYIFKPDVRRSAIILDRMANYALDDLAK